VGIDISNYSNRIIKTKIIEERKAEYSNIPSKMLPELSKYLIDSGIEKLYSHQSEMFTKSLERKNIVITTSTASGKTLSFLLPVLQDILLNPSSRAIFIYPTKALASDQFRAIKVIADYFGEGKLQVGTYDGDTPVNERSTIRNNANIILTNADMLNTAFLPNHSKYNFDFIFSNLKYVVIDEMHSYRGAFGAHFANVIKRLKRICKYYNSKPQFLTSSATIANPIELAENLCGEEFQLISRDGSPSARKNIFIWQPPLIKKTQYRVSTIKETAVLLPDLVMNNSKFINFCKSRKNVEVLLKEVRDRLQDQNPNYSELVSGYRGGYKAEERKVIENNMITGKLRGLISTNALELGIDIGSIDTVVVTGFPSSKASFWQESGRAGRKKDESNIFLILDSKPIDQYIAIKSEWLFAGDVENAIVDRNNLYIQIAHIRAAAAEIPLSLDDISLFPQLGEVIPVLMQAKELASSYGKYTWTGKGFPSGDYSLRNIDNIRYTLVNIENNEIITQMDDMQTLVELYKGAVYIHDGDQYAVVDKNIEDRVVNLKPVELNYYSQVLQNTVLTKIMEHKEKAFGRTNVYLGDINVETVVLGYKYIQFHNHTTLSNHKLEEPTMKDFDTEGMWYSIPNEVYRFLYKCTPAEEENIKKSYWTYFNALCFVLSNTIVRRTMGTESDVSVGTMQVMDEDKLVNYICAYDLYPGGLGFSNKAFDLAEEIIHESIEMIKGCTCEHGCIVCIGDYHLDKSVVLWALESMFKEVDPPENIIFIDDAEEFRIEKFYVLEELELKWNEFKEAIKNTGESMAQFISHIDEIKLNSNKLILKVENQFTKEWIEEPVNFKQLRNIIIQYVEVPSDFKIEVEAETDMDKTDRDKIIKRYEKFS